MAVAGTNDNTIIATDVVKLCKTYADNNADEIIIWDLSDGDKEHEEAIDYIHELCSLITIPVIGAGNVKRMEDIKKLLYAGCKRAILDYSKQSNIDITKEVSDKFGKDKIIVGVSTAQEFTSNEELINKYSECVLILADSIVKETEISSSDELKTIISLPCVSLDKMIEYLKIVNTEGITGVTVNQNYKEFKSIKMLVGEEALPFSIFKLNSDGHIPVIVQDYKTSEVLMLAYMNEEAYNKTLDTMTMHYYSRSRKELWLKGETSGHYQYVKSLSYDCDNDTILAKVEQIGSACHTGSYSCFFNDIVKADYNEKNPLEVLNDVYSVIADRKINPKEGSYTNYLFDKGIDKILKKVGEEATEIVIAAKNPNANEIKYEISDFLYHVMVLMVEKGVSWDEIMTELANR